MRSIAQTSMATPEDPFTHLSLVPAVVDGVQVPVACPATWCKQDHTGEDATKHLDDVDHSSTHIDLTIPNVRTGEDTLFGYVHLGQDVYSPDEFMRTPHLRFENGGGEETTTSLDQGLEFADRLVQFADEIRALVRTARPEVQS
ncbi:DUF6907 domain-containing protein [Streptomyces sp. NPDC007901]|uniref:DUF6907 domain-containing protein n=1 Tax=Streptomyces sp. NPDC007901 TaxID=3364785 RepID=UPI0036E8BDAB